LTGGATEIVITGRNLHSFFIHLSRHHVQWIWKCWTEQTGDGEDTPVMHGIEFREIAATRSAAKP
jgi:hypothetical protein